MDGSPSLPNRKKKKKNERNPAGKEGEGIIIKNKIKTAVVVTKSGCPVCLFFIISKERVRAIQIYTVGHCKEREALHVFVFVCFFITHFHLD